MTSPASNFIWYELMTPDIHAAEAFYKTVIGWDTEPFGGADTDYVVVKAQERGIGGIMATPNDANGMPPLWMGYVYAADANKATSAIAHAGGTVHRPAADIPDVGRFSVVADPQGATFMLLQPNGEDTPRLPQNAPGNVSWHELHASDWHSAFDFYASQFGWEKGDPMEMGEMGIYQLFTVDGELTGAMFNKPPEIPSPVWLFYFNVENIDAAAKRIVDGGGKIMLEPMEVPDGWIIQAADPQGAWFALSAPKR